MRLLPYGDRGVLVELDADEPVLSWSTALRELPHVLDVVPAARTVLVICEPEQVERVRSAVVAVVPEPVPMRAGELVEILVTYDGADLREVAGRTGLSVEGVVAAHAAGEYVAAFTGFAPGFAYLTGLDARLRVPRRASPRSRVPAGAVAIADTFSAVYPRASPGGWQLLGRTDAVLFDADRDPPALLAPGTRVRFRPA